MIPYFDYRPADRTIRSEIDAAIRRVLDSGRLILDAEGRAFEEEFAAWTGIPHAVGVASGTDALILALRALGVGRDDEVITVCNAGVPPVAAIRAVGATPRFVDVRSDTLLLDPTALPAALGERTRCIVPVHLYGQPVDLEPVLEFASAHRLPVVEDCAQAHGARYRGRHVGGFGDIGCFSFYPTKNLGAYGDGGLCVTGREDLRDRLRMLRMYGFRRDGHAHCEGINSRLDELQAAILRVKLGHLTEAIGERRALARRYVEGLAGSELVHPATTPETTHGYHLFVVQTADRRAARMRLEAAGVGFGLHYPEPVHRMQAYRFLELEEGTLPVSERACRSVLSLPLYPGLESASVDRVIRALGDTRGDRADAS